LNMLSPTHKRVQECTTGLHVLLGSTEERWLLKDWAKAMAAEMATNVSDYLAPELIKQGLPPAAVEEISRRVAVRIQITWGFWTEDFLHASLPTHRPR